MNIALVLLPTLLLLNACLNVLFLKRPAKDVPISLVKVAVLVPMRNEAHNVVALIDSLKKQVGVQHLEFVLIDDNSTDNTLRLATLNIQEDHRFRIVRGKELEKGWLGKPFALEQGRLLSDSDVIVTIDADVRLKPHAIAASLSLMSENNFDFLSPYPLQIAKSWSERLIQPLLQWSWMSTVPLGVAQKSSNPAFAVANGQFFFVSRSSLNEIGGFESIKSYVLEDIYLVRSLLRGGFHGTVANGSAIAQCQMYSSWAQLRDGYGKSLRVAFGGMLGNIVAITFLALTGIIPFALALNGSTAGLIGYFLVVFSRLISALTNKSRLSDCVFHPLSTVVLLYLLARSWWRRGTIEWKGRMV
ncbi:MAG: glycosyltransferase [Actinomycetes bacterium]